MLTCNVYRDSDISIVVDNFKSCWLKVVDLINNIGGNEERNPTCCSVWIWVIFFLNPDVEVRIFWELMLKQCEVFELFTFQPSYQMCCLILPTEKKIYVCMLWVGDKPAQGDQRPLSPLPKGASEILSTNCVTQSRNNVSVARKWDCVHFFYTLICSSIIFWLHA